MVAEIVKLARMHCGGGYGEMRRSESMLAVSSREHCRAGQILRDLVEVALSVILPDLATHHGAQMKLDLWMALRGVLARERRRLRLLWQAQIALRLDDRLIAQLAEAAYQTALQHGVQGAFLDVELGIWDGFHAVAKGRSIPMHEILH
jgi:hypothetical protein